MSAPRRKRPRRSHHDGLRGIEVPAPPRRGTQLAPADAVEAEHARDGRTSPHVASRAEEDRLIELAEDRGLRMLDGMVPLLSPEGLVQLEAMLRDSLASPRASERRHQTLGLLGRLVRVGEGVMPTVADYEAAYREAKEAGESWPHATTLIRKYGDWSSAVKASMRLEFVGTGARPKSSYARAHVGDYTPREVGEAILRCRRVLGDWPTEAEFRRFCVVERELAAKHGKPSPRAPAPKAWLKACGSWDAACEVARTLR